MIDTPVIDHYAPL